MLWKLPVISILLSAALLCAAGVGAPRAIELKNHAVAHPHQILIIRHAEKPEGEGNPNLSPRGMERAAALAHVIPSHFARPDFLIATKKSSSSNRPVETIEPLAHHLHTEIEANFKDEECDALARQVLTDPKFADKTVLIAWHHGKIPDLARALGATDAPSKWDSRIFDRVWELTYEHGVVHFKDLPQRALPGDSEK